MQKQVRTIEFWRRQLIVTQIGTQADKPRVMPLSISDSRLDPRSESRAQSGSESGSKPDAVAEIVKQAIEISIDCAARASEIDRHGALPIGEFEQLQQAGLLTAPLAVEWGGLGLGIDASRMSDLLKILKHIGRGNLSVGRIYEGHVNAVQLIQTFGTAEQIAGYAKDIIEHHKIFGVWNAEATDGVKLMPVESGSYQLIGSKTFCSGAGLVERPFASGILPDGRWQLCIVPLEQVVTLSQPDWWQPMGMKATASITSND